MGDFASFHVLRFLGTQTLVIFADVAGASLDPWTNAMRLDESSKLQTHRYADRFSVVRVETTGALLEPVRKSSSVPAVLVSVFVQPVATRGYRLWVDGATVPTGPIPAFRSNVIDLAAEPATWGAAGIDYVHFHVRYDAIDETAADLGFERVGAVRPVIARDDIVLAQITKTVLPFLECGGCGRASEADLLALDRLELILGAHLVQRYGATKKKRAPSTGGLAGWQRLRATELLRANLDGRLRLAHLARACGLSVSHFARAFKASFGVPCHRWLTEHRIQRAQELLSAKNVRLADVADQCGFGDQAAFTRTFNRLVGLPPGRWRREHSR
jgi:AraC family transcriptional regulator